MVKFVINLLLLAVIILSLSSFVKSENSNSTVDENTRYCFRFTWLGPSYDNSSDFKEKTCDDILNGAKGIPCTSPLVVTYNSNEPNTTWMWEEKKNTEVSSISCRLARGDVCAKYTYTFNKAVQNITYFCTKVNIENEGAATSGCYIEYRNGREIEVCVCESREGQRPCNDAPRIIPHIMELFVIGFVVIIVLQQQQQQQWAFR